MTYTTQMDAARQGIVTPQMDIVARKEQLDPDRLRAYALSYWGLAED